MKFNLLLYVPALADDLDIEYGIFIQHHLMDDADIELDYFKFDRINSENYALDIVNKNEVTKKVRKDCLVEGFTLNSHYSIDLDNGFNRSISRDEVRQIFICFKNNSKQAIDAFIRMTHDGKTSNYHIKDNLIFFQLWVAPEMENSSEIALSIGKINYSNFDYFCQSIKEEVNKQWHLMLNIKRDLSRDELMRHSEETAKPLQAVQEPSEPLLENIFAQPKDIPAHITVVKNVAETEPQALVALQHDSTPINDNKGSDSFKVIAYILLALGVLSILGKIFNGS